MGTGDEDSEALNTVDEVLDAVDTLNEDLDAVDMVDEGLEAMNTGDEVLGHRRHGYHDIRKTSRKDEEKTMKKKEASNWREDGRL